MDTSTRRDSLVYIIESPSPADDFFGRSEGDRLHQMLTLAEIPARHRRISSASLLGLALEELKDLAKRHPEKVIFLHFSAHGSTEGVAFTDQSVVTWADLRSPLAEINELAQGRMILCMSSCEGFAACRMAMDETEKLPYLGVVGHTGKPTWTETAFGFPTFYNLYVRGYGVDEAVRRMGVAVDNDGFIAVTGRAAKQAYLDQIQCPKPPSADVTAMGLESVSDGSLKSNLDVAA